MKEPRPKATPDKSDLVSLAERLGEDAKFRSRYCRIMDFVRYNQRNNRLHRPDQVKVSGSYAKILRSWKIPENASILDIGTGAGNELEILKRVHNTRTIIAYDQTDYQDNRLDRDMVLGYADILPFGAEKFDAIHCKDVLVHVADKPEFFRQVAEILKPRGKLLITTMEVSENYFPVLYEGTNVFQQTGSFSHVYTFPFATIDDFLAQADEYIEVIQQKRGGNPACRLVEVGMPYFKTSLKTIIELAVANDLRVYDKDDLPTTWKHEDRFRDWVHSERIVLSLVKRRQRV